MTMVIATDPNDIHLIGSVNSSQYIAYSHISHFQLKINKWNHNHCHLGLAILVVLYGTQTTVELGLNLMPKFQPS